MQVDVGLAAMVLIVLAFAGLEPLVWFVEVSVLSRPTLSERITQVSAHSLVHARSPSRFVATSHRACQGANPGSVVRGTDSVI